MRKRQNLRESLESRSALEDWESDGHAAAQKKALLMEGILSDDYKLSEGDS